MLGLSSFDGIHDQEVKASHPRITVDYLKLYIQHFQTGCNLSGNRSQLLRHVQHEVKRRTAEKKPIEIEHGACFKCQPRAAGSSLGAVALPAPSPLVPVLARTAPGAISAVAATVSGAALSLGSKRAKVDVATPDSATAQLSLRPATLGRAQKVPAVDVHVRLSSFARADWLIPHCASLPLPMAIVLPSAPPLASAFTDLVPTARLLLPATKELFAQRLFEFVELTVALLTTTTNEIVLLPEPLDETFCSGAGLIAAALVSACTADRMIHADVFGLTRIPAPETVRAMAGALQAGRVMKKMGCGPLQAGELHAVVVCPLGLYFLPQDITCLQNL